MFDTKRRPWIAPDAAGPGRIAETVRRCPTGALRYRRSDGGGEERPDPENVVSVRRDGPLYVRGDLSVAGSVRTRVALCRCGATKRAPYCDGSHTAAGYREPGLPRSRRPLAAELSGGRLRIEPVVDGPLLLEGPVEVRAADKAPVFKGAQGVALCRCGASLDPPYCDGSHVTLTR